ncbi:type I restriction-modification system subunit M N-terminal domain-containing protein [Mycolicibacterium doricum]|uniref:type I restriction-modification system subunit M N-terminal domain-containing protein n=1 Tax=Mycolicibacterium doricum TaxID=126673 RepID=UPI00269C55E2
MALKKSDLYASLWASCDQLRGGMDASQYKDYILTLLFVKYVSDKAKADSNSLIDVPEGGSFDDIALVSAVLVAVLSAFIARVLIGRDRRRQMYGEAFRVALEWREMVYRVRRRDNSKEHDRVLIDRFHELQERLDYYEGWIGSESRYMRRSFRRLVTVIKGATKGDLQTAWEARGRSGNADPDTNHPKIPSSAMDNYLLDVRSHLSLQPWRWPAVWWRNREDGR